MRDRRLLSRAPGRERRPPWLGRLGPGLITGAADDDPSGIATYSQAGARFGLEMLWTVVLTYPLMVAVQLISARIGRVTGAGLTSNLLKALPRLVVAALVLLVLAANTINVAADLSAMGAAGELISGLDPRILTVVLAVGSTLLQLFVPYHRYVDVLKWLTMALFAYVGVVFTVQIDWPAVLKATFWPQATFTREFITVVVALFGTTISPYLFFWQSSEEVEELRLHHDGGLRHARPAKARTELARIRWDTVAGMGYSNLVAYFIVLTTAVTLHSAGLTNIQTSAEAAQALRPIAGPLAFALFSLGIIGTGLLAVPVLAGSAAYAVGEFFGWPTGLERWPWQAKGFYAVIVAVMAVALSAVFYPLDPMQALFWSAVVNGVVSVPIMAAMMVIAVRRKTMGAYVASPFQLIAGWLATGAMATAVAGMLLV